MRAAAAPLVGNIHVVASVTISRQAASASSCPILLVIIGFLTIEVLLVSHPPPTVLYSTLWFESSLQFKKRSRSDV
jgi:hypothetical protein